MTTNTEEPEAALEPAADPAPPPAADPADPAPPPAADPATPTPKLLFQGPRTITGVSPTPVSGQFSAIGGVGPYTFSQDGALGDFQTAEDGFFALNPRSPMTGSVNITVTDAEGNRSEPAEVSVYIS